MPSNEQIIEVARRRLMPYLVRTYVDSQGVLASTHEVFFRDSVHVADAEAEKIKLEPKTEHTHDCDDCDDCMKIAIKQYETGHKDGFEAGKASLMKTGGETRKFTVVKLPNAVEEVMEDGSWDKFNEAKIESEYDAGFADGKASLKPLDREDLERALYIQGGMAKARALEISSLIAEHFAAPKPKRERITVTVEQAIRIWRAMTDDDINSNAEMKEAIEHVLNEEQD